MSDDTFGKITLTFKEDNKEVKFPTVDTLKDEATTCINVLNQKSQIGNGSINWVINYLTKLRKGMSEANHPLPDDCRIFVEITDASLECNLNDYEMFVALAGNFTYVSTSKKSDEVEDKALPIVAQKSQ